MADKVGEMKCGSSFIGLGMEEGSEEEAQYQLMLENGCENFQGWGRRLGSQLWVRENGS